MAQKILLGGATTVLIRYITNENKDHRFFKPYQSGSDVYARTTSIVTAPLDFACMSLEMAIKSINTFKKGLEEVLTLDLLEAIGTFISGFVGLILGAMFALIGIMSPVINAIDLIGGGIATLMQDNIDGNTPADDQQAPSLSL